MSSSVQFTMILMNLLVLQPTSTFKFVTNPFNSSTLTFCHKSASSYSFLDNLPQYLHSAHRQLNFFRLRSMLFQAQIDEQIKWGDQQIEQKPRSDEWSLESFKKKFVDIRGVIAKVDSKLKQIEQAMNHLGCKVNLPNAKQIPKLNWHKIAMLQRAKKWYMTNKWILLQSKFLVIWAAARLTVRTNRKQLSSQKKKSSTFRIF